MTASTEADVWPQHTADVHEAVEPLLEPIEDPALRAGVVDLFAEVQRRVDKQDVDLVVLCARRLPCLYELLVSAGLPAISGALVVSDRFLDVAAEWTWHNVLVVDDTVVLGTTLHGLVNSLQERLDTAGGGQVGAVAICADVDRRATYLFEGMDFTALHEVEQAAVQKFSTNLVSCLFRGQRPIFSDFPVSRRIRLSVADLEAALADTERWRLADVTSPIIAADEQTAFVQLPNRPFRDEVLSTFPPEVASLVHSFKLRCYTKLVGDVAEATDADVVLVPLVLLGACTPEAIDDGLRAFGQLLHADVEAAWFEGDSLRPAAKHRLLQMLASAWMLSVVADDAFVDAFGGRGTGWVNLADVDLYFGDRSDEIADLLMRTQELAPQTPRDAERIVPDLTRAPEPSPLLRDHGLQELLWAQREILESARPGEEPDGDTSMAKLGLVAAHAINSLFGYLSTEFEAPQQREIRRLGSLDAYYGEFEPQTSRRILHQGFTMSELAAAVMGQGQADAWWDREVVSLGIDMGNDLGIVVPTTLQKVEHGLVYRAYRLGETAELASSPLPFVTWRDGHAENLDPFLSALDQGFPAKTKIGHVDVRGAHRHAKAPRNAEWTTVALLALEALPGAVDSRWNGRVTGVVAPTAFDAVLTSVPSGDVVSVRMDLEQVPEAQRSLVGPGTTFKWTWFTRESGGRKDSLSRLDIHRSPVYDERAIARSMQTFAFLSDYVDDGASAASDDAVGNVRADEHQ